MSHPALRTAFHHEGLPWGSFVSAYRSELAGSPALAKLRQDIKGHDVVTLLFGSRDTEHNEAVVLQEVLASE